MKKIIKGISILMCFTLIAVMFAGCGKAKTVKVSELFDDDRIWYSCTTDKSDTFDKGIFDKDSVVETAYLINGDKLKICDFSDDRTLGDLENMDESEIKKAIDDAYNYKLTKLLNGYISKKEPFLRDYTAEKLSETLARLVEDITAENNTYKDDDSTKYNVDRNEYIERYHYEKVYNVFRSLIDINSSRFASYTSSDTDSTYENGITTYTIKFEIPIETVRNEMNTLYEKYPSIKDGIESVKNGGDAENAAENILHEISASFEATEEYQNIKAEGEKILKENDGYKYKLALVSDGTGNATNQEGFIYQYFTLNYTDGKVVAEYDNKVMGILSEKNWDYTADGMSSVYYKGDTVDSKDGNCIQVFDSFYGGVSFSDSKGGNALCTKLEKNSNIVLDEIDSKKFIIDPKDEILETAFD